LSCFSFANNDLGAANALADAVQTVAFLKLVGKCFRKKSLLLNKLRGSNPISIRALMAMVAMNAESCKNAFLGSEGLPALRNLRGTIGIR